ncbi:MAG: winged helix-turn-helix domain-containing protein [Rubrivivax sp.]|nr:winged helix-turn-helix domain-containing protein [Rubrivivax sp.]
MQKAQDIERLSAPQLAGPAAGVRAGKTVLLVSAEPFVRELLATHLRAAGCFPMAVASAEEGRRLAAQLVPDLIVLDLDANADGGAAWLPRTSGRSNGKAVRTVVLKADVDLRCGADRLHCDADLCVAKPFEPRELVRQLLRLLRPARIEEQRPRARPALKAAAIELDRQQPTVRLLLPGGWQSLDLPWTEHRLLAFLLADTTRARSRDAIRDAVWSDAPVDLRTVDQYVRRLRRRLDAAGARDLVKTVKGFGYALDLEALQRLQG